MIRCDRCQTRIDREDESNRGSRPLVFDGLLFDRLGRTVGVNADTLADDCDIHFCADCFDHALGVIRAAWLLAFSTEGKLTEQLLKSAPAISEAAEPDGSAPWDEEQPEPCCGSCGKPLYDFSDIGCGRCDQRSPEWGIV